MVPGERYVPLPQPGFRWNVLDYGGPNTISSPLRNSPPLRRFGNGWVVGLEGRSTLSLCSERALNLAPARSRAQT